MCDVEINVNARQRCGYCRYFIESMNCILVHDCFRKYDEDLHNLYLDDNNGVVMIAKQDMSTKRKKFSTGSKNKKFQDELRLIEEIEKRPALFDKNIQAITSFAERERLWDEIEEIVCDDAKKKWRNLRDQYHKDKNNFRHFKAMSFLRDSGTDITKNCQASSIHKSAGREMQEIVNDENVDPNENEASCSQSLPKSSSKNNLCNENISSRLNNRRAKNDVSPSSKSPTFSGHSERMGKNLKTKPTKEDLQMMVLEKIRSHKLEQSNPSNMFLLSLSDTFSKLEHFRQLRVQRRFMEILEQEYAAQEGLTNMDSDD